MNSLKLYSDWTGDNSLLITYREKILALIERPLNPVFRDKNQTEKFEILRSGLYKIFFNKIIKK